MLSPGYYLIRTLKSPLFLAIAWTILMVLLCSRYMSYTLFHYCTWFDDYTLRTSNIALKDLVTIENQDRLNHSTQYLSSLQSNKSGRILIQNLQPGPGKDVLISIITTDRINEKTMSRPSYFTQTIAKILHEFEKYQQKRTKWPLNIGIVICDVDANPLENEELKFVKNTTSLPVIYGFNASTSEPSANSFDQEKRDYAFCLNNSFYHQATIEGRPRFVLLLEDDALPVRNYFYFLEEVVRNRLDRNFYRFADSGLKNGISRHDFLYVKLFHPEAMLAFHSLDAERIPQLFAVGIIFTLISAYAITVSSKLVQPLLTWSPNFGVLFKLWVYFTTVTLILGRPNVVLQYQNFLAQHLGILTTVPAPSCCTPAVLYPDSAISIVNDRLISNACDKNYAKDAILDDLRLETNRSAVLIQPNLHKHIGSYSVVRGKENSNYRHYLGIENDK